VAQTFKPPATQRVYDACVVGSQLGGVVAGALLARRGFRVLHVDHDGVGPAYEDGGWLLPHAPAVLPGPRLFPAADAVLQELGLVTDVSRALEPSVPDLQILLPRARFDLAREPARRAAELRREWPKEAEALDAALADLARQFDAATPFFKAIPPLPVDGLGDRWRLHRAKRLAAGAPGGSAPDAAAPFRGLENHPLARALSAVARFLCYLDGEPAPLGLVRLLGALTRGTYRLPGGLPSLREMVRRKIAESRGELLGHEGAIAIAEGLDFDGNRVTSVRVAGSQDAFSARVFLLATDAPAVRRLLPDAVRTSKRAKLLDHLRTPQQLLTVNWVVRPEGLPPGLGETAVALGEPGEDGVAHATLLQVLPARRAPGKAAEKGEARVLCAASFMPAATRDLGEEHLVLLAGHMKAAVGETLPFFERHILHQSLPAIAAAKERRGSRLMPHPLYEVDLPQTLGVTGLPTVSPWKNLLFAGREVVPGLGIEGEFHAGLQAAAAAGRLLGAKGKP
jgi:phytoene dehydrogenase-like protein